MTATPAVRTIGLGKRFGPRVALRDLDLEVPAGTVFGYLGPNGAGKTTTLKLLAGLYRPSTGRSLVLGADVMTHRDETQRRIGYLPGDFNGYADHTGERFLGLIGHLRGGVDPAYVEELTERFTLDPSRRIGTLSHGNRQKIGIIQAFMHRPEVLLLDEPTNGLDPLMQAEFLDLLRETRERGATVVLSSHVLAEVAAVADDVGILLEGRLLAVRSLEELRAETARRIELTFARPLPGGLLDRVAGVDQVRLDDRRASLRVTGPTAELFTLVAPYGVVDVRTQETDLGELFMSYYSDAKEAHDEDGVPEGGLGPAPIRAGVG